MKKFLLMASLCLAVYSGKAQVTALTINQSAPCDVSFQFVGNTIPGCSGANISPMKTMAPGGTGIVFNSNTAGLGIPAGNRIVGIRIYNASPACGGTLIATLGDPCWSPNTTYSYTSIQTPGCTTCGGTTNVTWTVTGPGTATINFF